MDPEEYDIVLMALDGEIQELEDLSLQNMPQKLFIIYQKEDRG